MNDVDISELVVEPEDALLRWCFVGLDEDAVPGFPPQSLVKGGAIEVVVLAQDGLDRISSLHGVVVWDWWEDMVQHMRVGDLWNTLLSRP